MLTRYGHNLVHHKEVQPTCITDGHDAYDTCSRCDYTTYKEIPAKGHDYKTTLSNNEITHYYECNNCNAKKDEAYHEFVWIIDKAATEEETGLKHEECNVCHFKRNENTIVEKLDHTHNMNHVLKVDKTCTTDGNIEYYHCSKCNKNFLDEKGIYEAKDLVIKASHEYGSFINEIASTCIKEGIKGHYECSSCHKYFDENKKELDSLVISKKNHEIVKHAKKEATCTENGYEAYETCKNCDYTTYKEILAKGHDYKATLSNNEITHYYECNNCNAKKDEAYHEFVWIIDKAATEEETGLKHEECNVCHFKRNENTIVEKLDHTHNINHVLKVDKTCTIDGNIEYYHCSKCNKNYLDEKGLYEVKDVVIKSTGHVIVKSGNVENGITKINYACANCNYKYSTSLMINDSTEFDINYTDYLYPTIEKTVHNNIDSILLSGVIKVPTGCSWTLSKDIEGSKIISTKNMSLSIGNNYAYITLWDANKEYNTVYGINIYRLNMFKYTFSDNNKILKTETIEENTIIDEPNFNLIKNEYALTWKDNKTNEIVSFPYTIKKDVNFVSNWIINKYIVSFDTDGGDYLESIEVAYNKKIQLPIPTTLLVNNVFVGWEYNDRLYDKITVTKNITLKAIWTKDFNTKLLSNGTVEIVKYLGNDQRVVFPKYTTSIGKSAFEGCSNLTNIEIPSSVTSIGNSAFSGCSSLTSIEIPFVGNGSDKTNFGYIFGASSYSNNSGYVPSSLKEVKILDGCTSIGDLAFWDCSSLTSITIPSSVTSIGYKAFNNCSSLTSIEIPSSVTSIGNSVFEGCSSLTSITIPFVGNGSDITNFGYLFGVSYSRENSICVPSSLKEVKILNGCISIGKYAFEGCSSLKSITIPNSVTSIGESAFYNCSNLISITIPFVGNGTDETSFGYIFGASSYSDNSKYVPSSLREVKILYGCTSIDDYTFSGCSDLTSIAIPGSVTNIGNYVFSGCNLSNIVVDRNNKVYDSRNDCNAIIETETNTLIYGCMNTTIPNNVKSIGRGAFSNCSGLTSISIPNSVTSIGNYAFSGCNLTNIIISSNVRTIGDSAFRWCSNLTIYCEIDAKPDEWDYHWNYSNCKVVWNYKKNN